jgi:hypothetical protein
MITRAQIKPIAPTKPIAPSNTTVSSKATAAPNTTNTNAVVAPRSFTPVQNQAVLKNAPVMATSAHSISGVIPAEGPRSTAITISGQKFGNVASDVQVKINGVSAIITGVSDNQITCTVPDKAGSGPISVAVKGKWATGSGFTYDWNATTSLVAGGGNNVPGYGDGAQSNVKFNHPTGLARDAQGYIYIADCENNRIRKMNNLGEVTTIAGSGAVGFADGMGTAAMFHHPTALAVDAAGNIYVTDQDNYRIRKITPSGMVTTLAGNEKRRVTDGTGTSASFGTPVGVCIDGSNNIYVADGTAIRKITPAGTVTTMSGVSFGGSIIALVYSNNEIYVASNNSMISKLTASGMVKPVAGSNRSYGVVDGYGTVAKFGGIVGMAMDANGVLYVTEADPDNYPPIHVRRVAKDGYVSTIGGIGTGMGMLAGAVGDAANTFYIADKTWNCVRKITLQ